MSVDLVIPTLGRPSLARLLDALAEQAAAASRRVILVEDTHRADRTSRPLSLATRGLPQALTARLEICRSDRPGPAAARNVGWRRAQAEWVAFLDDDVIPGEHWYEELGRDLHGLPADVGATQGRVRVPLSEDRRPTDWERNVAGLEGARWATADMAYRRDVLARVGGFDERFAHAYREDTDLGLRVTSLGLRITRGEREVLHPAGTSPFWASVRLQQGNADDALMRRLHGRGWRERANAPRGRLPRHALSCAGTMLAGAAALAARPRVALPAALVAMAGIGELAAARILPGPRDPSEVLRMGATSLVLPFAAVYQRALGELRWRTHA
ncbi:MAG TPA: glycosyltransferase family 2 protein [Solirubrobacteraceae bacterium]|nr:glycosyltransferase family 2 protein [Solirubrobacteraceae bacterium]